MDILSRAFGAYQTNCYIVKKENQEVIIDPGMGATSWILENVTNPVGILNTHGHFDHVWSDCELKDRLNIPIYIPKGDAFMLESDIFSQGQPICTPDVEVEGDKTIQVGSLEVKYIHFPGHTPGCSVIEIDDSWFSGDFIFENSIGRVDFPYSSPEDMRKSLKKFIQIDYDKTVYPGHGNPTTIAKEQKNSPYWIKII